MFANWQAVILQFGSLIIFGTFLRQRGAAHSLKPGSSGSTSGFRLGRSYISKKKEASFGQRMLPFNSCQLNHNLAVRSIMWPS
jgi:hypothetical protein